MQPVGGGVGTAKSFFEAYLACPVVLVLWLGWKIYTREGYLFIRAKDMDILTGLRADIEVIADEAHHKAPTSWKNAPRAVVRALF